MSHYRNLGGGRRDTNEPEIMARFQTHGWHPEQVSGNRQWDLNVYPSKPTMTGTNNPCFTLVCHVDVKGPKGKVEDAQRQKWTALAEKGIPVYVVRTERDVDALVRGDLQPWHVLQETLHALALPPRSTPVDVRTRLPGKVRKEWRPLQSVPVAAAKEAETFAPLPLDLCDWGGCLARRAFGGRWCPEHRP